MGPAPHLHNSSGQQVPGAGVETLAWTSLSLFLGYQGLSLHGVDCHGAVPLLAQCSACPGVLRSLRGLATGKGAVEILVFVCSLLREKAPLLDWKLVG